MSALPQTVDFDAQDVWVWNLIISAERAAMEKGQSSKYQDDLVGVRVLGFFLIDFYKHAFVNKFALVAYDHLLFRVKSCFAGAKAVQQANVLELGRSYRHQLLGIFRADSEPMSPASSDTSWSSYDEESRPSFDQVKLEMIQKMEKAEKTKSDVRDAALLRDGYKCMLTGAVHAKTCIDVPELLEIGSPANVECCHLFSEFTKDAYKPAGVETSASAMLKMFGLDHEVEKLFGDKVNSLCNVLSMRFEMKDAFDRFALWLEEVAGTENTYQVAMSDPERHVLQAYRPKLATRVTFKVNPDCVALCQERGTPLPELPNRNLIAIRAACARVAHVSGAVEQIDRILQDEEDTAIMAFDGSTADLLTSLLNARAVERYDSI